MPQPKEKVAHTDGRTAAINAKFGTTPSVTAAGTLASQGSYEAGYEARIPSWDVYPESVLDETWTDENKGAYFSVAARVA